MGEINWDKWSEDRYIKLDAGRPKVMALIGVEETTTNVRHTETNGTVTEKNIPCLQFSVSLEDGTTVDKLFSVTSRRLAQKLRPFAEKGFPFTVKITQFGSGFKTEYDVVAA